MCCKLQLVIQWGTAGEREPFEPFPTDDAFHGPTRVTTRAQFVLRKLLL